MASVFTIQGANSRPSKGDCKCYLNKRTGKYAEQCYVGKGKRSPTGYLFQKGGHARCVARKGR